MNLNIVIMVFFIRVPKKLITVLFGCLVFAICSAKRTRKRSIFRGYTLYTNHPRYSESILRLFQLTCVSVVVLLIEWWRVSNLLNLVSLNKCLKNIRWKALYRCWIFRFQMVFLIYFCENLLECASLCWTTYGWWKNLTKVFKPKHFESILILISMTFRLVRQFH